MVVGLKVTLNVRGSLLTYFGTEDKVAHLVWAELQMSDFIVGGVIEGKANGAGRFDSGHGFCLLTTKKILVSRVGADE